MTKRRKFLVKRHLVDSKWVLKERKDGRSRACLVKQGYKKIKGVDFNNNYLPVVYGATLEKLIAVGD